MGGLERAPHPPSARGGPGYPDRSSRPRLRSGVQDHLHRVARPSFEDGEGFVDAAQRELMRDERLGRDTARRQQGQTAPHAGTALAALGVDRDIAAYGVAEIR